MKALLAVSLAGLLFVAAGSRAGESQPLTAADSAGFQAQSQTIKRELADGKTYSEVDAKQRADVLGALDRIGAALAAHGKVEEMSENGRIQLFNDQELVNAILTKGRADSRLLCTRTTPVGSHRPTTSCQTVAERQRIQERTQDMLRKDFQGQALKSN